MINNSLFVQSNLGSSTVDIYPTALKSTQELFDMYAEFIEQFQNEEMNFSDYAVLTSKMQFLSAQIEHVNSLFSFFKTFEKGLQSGITA